MALAITRENFLLHKLHSLSGVVPVGFYMVQHLTLNSFSLGGREKFDAVIGFFEAMPKHILFALEIGVIWLPLLFHSVYGLFITNRGQQNFLNTKYGWSQNRMYTMQRWSGIVIFFFLAYHTATTTIYKYITNDVRVIEYDAWHAKLSSLGGLILLIYMIGIAASAYHLSYGLWNFAIRWGITISEKAQNRIQRFSVVAFVGLTLLGWAALGGFFLPQNAPENRSSESTAVPAERQTRVGA